MKIYFYFEFSASEVASNKKKNGSEYLPIKVRSFAKKMDDSSKYREPWGKDTTYG